MKIGLALTFGILYWLATNKLWYGTLHLVRHGSTDWPYHGKSSGRNDYGSFFADDLFGGNCTWRNTSIR